jgi:hypothetical protein
LTMAVSKRTAPTTRLPTCNEGAIRCILFTALAC